jgi:hypothetical protein
MMLGMMWALVFQIAFLIVAGWNNRLALTPDGVALIRIASYYASGQTQLMISGYWGPLLSWLMVPWMYLGVHPLDAARIVMGLSAVVFLLGCISIFRVMQIPRAGAVLGTWVVAAASVVWCVDKIAADLLMGGLLCFAVSRMISPQWIDNPSTPFVAGIFCGASYLAKAVAFPLTFGLGLGLGVLWIMSRLSGIKKVLRSVVITMLGFALVAIPWVLILSWQYQRLTVSTSARINHALGKPTGQDFPHIRMFHIPEPGRITWWEDPSRPFTSWQGPSHTSYTFWSPFTSVANLRHQLWRGVVNYKKILHTLQEFDLFGLGVFALVGGLLCPTPWGQNLGSDRWRWSGVLVACLCSMYLPFFAGPQRYYFPTYPFLIAASMGMVGWLTHKSQTKINVPRLIGFGLVVSSFSLPILLQLPATLRGRDNQGIYAYKLAQKLQAAGLHGPLASVANLRGLYIAFFMKSAWYGSEDEPTPERLKASGAKLIIVPRGSPLLSTLNQDADLKALDRILFESEDQARPFPWIIYQVVAP